MNQEKEPTYLNHIQSSPIFRNCPTSDLVKLIPHIKEEIIPADTVIFKIGENAENLYYLHSGEITLSLGEKAIHTFTQGFFGEECAVGSKQYLCDAKISSESIIWKITAHDFKYALGKNTNANKEFYSSLFGHYSSEYKLFIPKIEKGGTKNNDRLSTSEWIGWGLTLILPIFAWELGLIYELDIKTKLFLTVFSCISVMWVFRLVAEFIACILGVLALVILGVAPAEYILQGFGQGEFFMAMSIFGVGAVLATSGLTFRLVLFMLKYIPSNPIFHSLSMMISGFLLTPVLPSANGRIVLVSPLMQDMLTALKYLKKGNAANALAISTFMGYTLFSSIFLTSKPINFVVFSMLPPQYQEHFQFVGWLSGTVVSALILFGLCMFGLIFFYRSTERPELSTSHINAQIKILGPLSSLEWLAMITVGIFIFGSAFSSIHKIAAPWIALAVLVILLTIDVLKRKEFHEKVDWSFIMYLAGLIGLVKTMSAVGIDTMLAKNLTFIGHLMQTNFSLFVIALFGMMTLIRIIVPNNATIAIFCTILLPISQINGINPWVVGYIILTFSDGWLLPFQCTYYLLFKKLTEKNGFYDEKEILRFNLWTNVFRVAAIFASIPYWKWQGLI